MSDETTKTGMSDKTINMGYQVVSIGTKRAALFSDGTLVPMIMGGSGGGKGGEGGGGEGGEGAGGEGKVFTQAEIDALIKKKQGEAYTKSDAQYSGQISELTTEVQSLKTQLEAKPKDGGKGGGNEGDFTTLKEKVVKIEGLLEKSRNKVAMGEIKSIAADLGAFNSDQIATLIKPFIKIEDGKTSVINAEGKPRYDGEGLMDVKALVKEFLNSNLHLVKGSGQGGAGSERAKFNEHDGKKIITRETFNKLSPTEQQAAATDENVAIID